MPAASHVIDIKAVSQAAEVLMAPLDSPTTGEWLVRSLQRVRIACDAEASVIVGPNIPPRGVASPDLPASVVTQFESMLRFPRDELHWVDTALESVYRECRRNPSRIHTMGEVRAFLGPQLEESAMFRTVIAPTGLLGSASAVVATPGSETILSVMSSRPDRMELAGMRLAAFQLLRNALAAGLGTLGRVRNSRHALAKAFDDVGTGLAIFDGRGLREIARNGRLNELLRREAERARLTELLARLACRAAAPLGSLSSRVGDVPGYEEEVDLADGIYHLVASRVEAGTLLREPAVLVLVDRLDRGLPSTGELKYALGLKGHEADVALLAAEGLSNKAIACRLGLSSHTVRHYLERVFDQLEIHSRNSLGLLLAGIRDQHHTAEALTHPSDRRRRATGKPLPGFIAPPGLEP